MKSRTARLFWLIVKHENCRIKIFTIESGSGRETLPIFGHKEEAEIFLWLNSLETDWRVRKTTAGDLVSVLCGPYANVKKVALDPLSVHDGEALLDLVSLGREEFVRNLIGEHKLPALRQSVPEPALLVASDLSETSILRETQWGSFTSFRGGGLNAVRNINHARKDALLARGGEVEHT